MIVASAMVSAPWNGITTGNFFPCRAVRLAEISIQHFSFVVDLHAFERRPRHFPGFVEGIAHFLVGGHHARFVNRLRPARLAVKFDALR